ncbi:TMEM175 family protein [Larkinella knui]|uniref:DUF1211 domain-containing protein n=1 Tax=Larkinella knui TaxID=2025310 RepID=A0A3P1CEZ3_9BACT|nr:TMEM175 family protein [Larkinella knui]RRB11901.1 DUF1211 domain-containing protein [Larkinella knui]
MDPDQSTEVHQGPDALSFERIVFFSDAVFAIAITLLVIEIKVPEIGHHTPGHAPSIEQLYQQWPGEFRKLFPKFFGFVLSFLVIGQYWINHHRNFGIIRRFDKGLL